MLRLVHLLGCGDLTAEQRQVAVSRVLAVLIDEFGSVGKAIEAHAVSKRLRDQFAPGDVPNDERAPVDRWEGAYDHAKGSALSTWSNDVVEGAQFKFAAAYRVWVRRAPLSGFAKDGTRRNILTGEYNVLHDEGRLLFFDADVRGGDIVVDLDDYPELGTFPAVLAHTQLEVIGRL